ncbi:MAG: uroporphyrinogen decarboxylase family protein [Victivallaceae bacterium]
MSSHPITAFLAGETAARTPFMPILMRFCAQYTKTPYRDFILDPEAHCRSNIECARAFGSDWVNVMSDPYGELEAYGAHIEYPENSLPLDKVILFDTLESLAKLESIDFVGNRRIQGRLRELEIFRRELGDSTAICGWVEGPLAEYCDLRSMGNAFLDLYDDPATVKKTLQTLYRNAERFITLQVEAGANMIGIGDAACSQLGEELYREFAWELECRLVEHIHRLGALAKLHICGNTSAILPGMIATGADIIDVDHLVSSMTAFAPLLRKHQALCGNLDPVSVVQNGDPATIERLGRELLGALPGKLILSAGCEVTPGTAAANLHALSRACTKA